MVKETTEGEHSGGFFDKDDKGPQLTDFRRNLSGCTSASWGGLHTPPSFISKVVEEDMMQETHHDMEVRAAPREAMTTAMIGANL